MQSNGKYSVRGVSVCERVAVCQKSVAATLGAPGAISVLLLLLCVLGPRCVFFVFLCFCVFLCFFVFFLCFSMFFVFFCVFFVFLCVCDNLIYEHTRACSCFAVLPAASSAQIIPVSSLHVPMMEPIIL